jgi:hypothetical protein
MILPENLFAFALFCYPPSRRLYAYTLAPASPVKSGADLQLPKIRFSESVNTIAD